MAYDETTEPTDEPEHSSTHDAPAELETRDDGHHPDDAPNDPLTQRD